MLTIEFFNFIGRWANAFVIEQTRDPFVGQRDAKSGLTGRLKFQSVVWIFFKTGISKFAMAPGITFVAMAFVIFPIQFNAGPVIATENFHFI